MGKITYRIKDFKMYYLHNILAQKRKAVYSVVFKNRVPGF